MATKQQFCSKCGAEITEPNAEKCANCGEKIKKPLYKKWWFWVIVGVCVIGFGGMLSEEEGGDTTDTQVTIENVTQGSNPIVTQKPVETQAPSSQKTYEVVDLQDMFDELDANALRAESKYQDKYVQFEGKIASFDSDGAYISVEPVDADEWNFTTILCYITEKEQKEYLMNLSTGDKVTIKGKITSIGEIIGYSMKIHEIK